MIFIKPTQFQLTQVTYSARSLFQCAVQTCPVCNETKDRDLMFETGRSRCISCEFCVRCQNQTESKNKFDGNDDTCVNCRSAEVIFQCAVQTCRQELTADHFEKDILMHAQSYGRLRVCRGCTQQGYTPRDVVPYKCQSSRTHFAGHLNFPKRTLDNFKRKRTTKLVCLACANEEWSQEKCKKRKRGDEESFFYFWKHNIFACNGVIIPYT